MRTNSGNTVNNLHWHDGSTCHGHSTLNAAIKLAKQQDWVPCKILCITDKYANGKQVKCYSIVIGNFEHYKKYGKLVAELERKVNVRTYCNK